TSAGDPFGWIRADGHGEIFAIDPSGALVRSWHDASGWTDWAPVGGTATVATCLDDAPSPSSGSGLAGATTGGSESTGVGGGGGAVFSRRSRPRRPPEGDRRRVRRRDARARRVDRVVARGGAQPAGHDDAARGRAPVPARAARVGGRRGVAAQPEEPAAGAH